MTQVGTSTRSLSVQNTQVHFELETKHAATAAGRKSTAAGAIMQPARKSLRKSLLIQTISPLDPVPGIPQGLEALEGSSLFYMKREVHTWPDRPELGPIKIDNRFSILNQNELRIMFVGELVNINGHCLPPFSRPYVLQFYDPLGKTVMEVERPWNRKMSCCGAEDYGNDIFIKLSTSNEKIGKIVQNLHACECNNGFTTSFDVYDDQNAKRLKIRWGRRPCFRCRCSRDKSEGGLTLYECTNGGRQTSVLITKFLDMDTMDPGENILLASHSLNLGIHVPADLDCKLKALLLAFMFNIFITYFEHRTESISSDPLEPERRRRLGYYGCTGLKIFKILLASILIGFLVIGALFLSRTPLEENVGVT